MLKKTITSTDLFTNTTTTADYYFNLTKAEAVEINLIEDLEDVSKSTDPKAIIPVFKNIINYSYGIKTRDGKFTKDKDLTTGFLASDAYSELFLELLQDGEQGIVNFINAILGFNVDELRNAEQATGTARNPQPEGTTPAPITVPSLQTQPQPERAPWDWKGDAYPTDARPDLGDTWNGRSLQRPVKAQEEMIHAPQQPGEQLGFQPSVYEAVRQQHQTEPNQQ